MKNSAPDPAGEGPHAAADLLPLVYDELRRLASAQMAREQPGQTLSATALVHEVWLRLAALDQQSDGGRFTDRIHFLRTAATAMRRILIDRARARKTAKRDGGKRVDLPDCPESQEDEQLLALDAALTRLAQVKPDHARLVELRYFAGQTGDEAAAALGISPSTADRMWYFARAWLHREMTADPKLPDAS